MKAIEVVSIGLNAALYAGFGYLSYLGIFAPVVGVVRFWPSVVIPAVFAILFGPVVGGVGAAIGIFISDMLIHGIALLSLTVGVPSNFLGFYVLGYLARKNLSNTVIIFGCVLSILFATSSIWLYFGGLLDLSTSILFAAICLLGVILTIFVSILWPEWRSSEVASIVGLGLGSAYIGLGLWAYSQFFPLPKTLGFELNAPLYASVIWFIWTYGTEIPFLVLLVPPILRSSYIAFPKLKSDIEKSRK